MFDIGFSELLLVGLVALLVLGPERLPGAIRTTSLWVGRIKRSFQSIKAEVEREIGADEIRRQLHNEQILQMEREMKALKEDLRSLSASKPLDLLTPSSSGPAPASAEPASTKPSTEATAEPTPAPAPAPASTPNKTPEP